MTPLLQTQTRAEARYNEALIRTRVIVENTFGIWKRRFPIMAYGCRTKLPLTLNMIIATAVLHNIARNAGEELPPNEPEHNEELFQQLLNRGRIDEILNNAVDQRNNNGFQVRRQLIDNFFVDNN